MKAPTADTVREMLLSLVEGSGSRSEIEEWACAIVSMRDPPKMPAKVWVAINALAGCDERDGGPEEPYVFARPDFEAWLADFDTTIEIAPNTSG